MEEGGGLLSLPNNGDALFMLAAAVTLQLARSYNADELELMAAFFTVLGDNIALWLARLPQDNGESNQPCK